MPLATSYAATMITAHVAFDVTFAVGSVVGYLISGPPETFLMDEPPLTDEILEQIECDMWNIRGGVWRHDREECVHPVFARHTICPSAKFPRSTLMGRAPEYYREVFVKSGNWVFKYDWSTPYEGSHYERACDMAIKDYIALYGDARKG